MSDSTEGLNPSSIGRENLEMIFHLIQQEGEVSRTDIAESSGLSKTAVSSSVDQLLQEGLIREDKHKKYSKVGRKPRLLSVNSKGRHFISMDIGGTSVKYGLGNLGGELEKTGKIRTPDHWKELYQDVLEVVRGSRSWSGVSFEKIKGLAIAVPGVVNEDGTVNYAPNIDGLDQVRLGCELEEELSIPIFLENDVNASALGEYRKRKSNYSSLVFIAIGTGVGAGIILNGELFKGATNHAGEVGWFVSELTHMGEKGNGKKGWLESRISGPDIVRRAREKLKQVSDDPLRDQETKLSPRKILETRTENTVAGELTEDWINVVAMLVSNITAIIDPELVVLGGGVSKTGSRYIEEIKSRVTKNTQHTPEIEASELGDEAPLYGGIAVCRQNISQFIR